MAAVMRLVLAAVLLALAALLVAVAARRLTRHLFDARRPGWYGGRGRCCWRSSPTTRPTPAAWPG